MSGQDQNSDFKYQGYLIFNEFYEVELFENSSFRDGSIDAQEQLASDYTLQRSSQTLPEDRVEVLDQLIKLPSEFNQHTGETIDSSQLVPLRFFYEKRVSTEGYLPGETQLRKIELPTISDADIYWVYPDRVYFRGSKSDTEEAVDFFRDELEASVVEQTQSGDENHPRTDGGECSDRTVPLARMTEVSFSSDFLLWMFQRYVDSTSLPSPSNIEINRLTDAAITGNVDVWGGNHNVSDSTELAESPPLLSSILQNKYFKMIEGRYDINGNSVQVETQINKVHVKVSTEDVRKSDGEKRMALALTFLEELTQLHHYWINLDPSERYPDYDFFLDLFDMCDDHGVRLDHISRTLRRRFRDLRNESDSAWAL